MPFSHLYKVTHIDLHGYTGEVLFVNAFLFKTSFFVHSLYILYHNLFLIVIYHGHYVLLMNEVLTQFFKNAVIFHGMYLTLSLWIDIYVVYSFCHCFFNSVAISIVVQI